MTVSFVTVPSPLELSIAILSWNSRSYLEMPTINQLNSLAGQSTKTMKTSPPALPLNIISANILPMVLLAKLLPFPRFYSPFPRFSFPHFPFLLLGQPPETPYRLEPIQSVSHLLSRKSLSSGNHCSEPPSLLYSLLVTTGCCHEVNRNISITPSQI